jgi:hypothetical protein
MNFFKVSLVVSLSIFLSFSVRADIGKPMSHFSSSYGKPVGDKPTSTGRIVAWKMDGEGVIMAEFGPDGMARNVVYRTKGAMSEASASSYLSRNSGGSGTFHRVDVPQLNSILNNLPKMASDPNAPEEVRKFASAMNPQVIASLSQTINSVGDLRATKDGKYLGMVDTRGQVLVLKIDGPSLPLLK